MVKDEGDIVAEIRRIKSEIRIEQELTHCKGHVDKPEKHEDNPAYWMMSTCHEMANVSRKEVSKETKPIRLEIRCKHAIEINNVMHHRVVKEVVRIIDARNEVVNHVLDKFKHHGNLVNIDARTGYNGGVTKAQIKGACGYNPHGIRENMINEGKSDRFPRCLNTEDWTHVITYSAAKKFRKTFTREIKEKLNNVKNEKNDKIK